MVYLAAGRMPMLEALIAYGPWLLILALEFGGIPAAVWLGKEAIFIRGMIALQILSPFLVFVQTALLMQFQIRRYFEKLPMEQISLTTLSGAEIVHGLIIRSLASLSIILFSTWALMIFGVCLIGAFSPGATQGEMAMLSAACIVSYFFQSYCMESATAMGLRANLFVKDAAQAFIRASVDWLAGAAIVGVNVALVVLVIIVYAFSIRLGPIAPLLIGILSIVLTPLIIRFVFAGHLSELEYSAGAIMKEAAGNRAYWWFATDDGGIDVSGKRLFKSWGAMFEEEAQAARFRENLAHDSMDALATQDCAPVSQARRRRDLLP